MKKKVKKQSYPGVFFDKNIGRWIAKCIKNGITHVATVDSFKIAKEKMIEFNG